jgi:hypothetical protein
MKFFSSKPVITLLAIATLFAGTNSVWAQTCMNDNFNAAGKKGELVCTAKEVFIGENPDGSKIIDAMVVPTAEFPEGDNCRFPGDTATVDIVATLHFNADRFDVGIYSALDGGDGLRGECATDPLPLSPTPATDLDAPPDICGDVLTDGGGADLPNFKFQRMKILCEDTDQDGFLDFTTCFSWRTSGNNDLCDEPTDLFPGTKSKCFCERVNIPVEVPPAELKVVKKVSTEGINFLDSVRINEPGATVTFKVEVTNTGIDPNNYVTLTSLVDSIYGDLDIDSSAPHDWVTSTCLDDNDGPMSITPGGTYTCSFTANVTGNRGDSETNTVTASGVDDNDNDLSGKDDATVTIDDVQPIISLVKTVNPIDVLEPGAEVNFTVEVKNNSVSTDPVTIDSLTDNIHGNLNGQGNCSIPQTILPGDTYSCTFMAPVTGNAGDSETDTATATGHDDEGNSATASDSATVNINDVESSILLTKTANPTNVNETGANVLFTFVINNTSLVDSVAINSLTDSIYGDLNGQGNCSVPQLIAAGDSYTCLATFSVKGDAGDVVTNVATASGLDDDGNPVSCDDDATVNIVNVPPVASLTKNVSQMIVTYQVLVTNDSAVESLFLDSLVDSKFGDITQIQGDIVETTCAATGQEISIGGSYSCSFDAVVKNSPHTNILTGVVSDNEGGTVSPSDSATVTFGSP